ncbi:ACT domain-containing protein [Planctomycetota bacterium]
MMSETQLKLGVIGQGYAVCRLAPKADVPSWADSSALLSITRTPDELSIVCTETNVPTGVRAERGWAVLKVLGPLEFSLVGILSSLTQPLAKAGIPVFVISTFDTDYLLVKQTSLPETVDVLGRFCEVMT